MYILQWKIERRAVYHCASGMNPSGDVFGYY